VQHFQQQIAPAPHTWAEAAAAPFFQNTPFYPVGEMLHELLDWRHPAGQRGDFQNDAAPTDQLPHLVANLERAGLKAAETIPLIAPLLNLALPADYLPPPS